MGHSHHLKTTAFDGEIMGYSNSRKSITRVRDYLEAMLEAEGKLTWAFENGNSAAYAIRAGIKAAQKQEDPEYNKYGVLQERFLIRVDGNTVIAEPRNSANKLISTPIIPNVTDAFGLLQVMMVDKKNVDRVLFSHLRSLDGSSGEVIVNWCSNNGYAAEVTENGLLLKKVA